MLTRDTMQGLCSLPPTPFDEQGKFWESAYRENLRTLMEFGVDAIYSPGSNGEWWTMDDDVRRRQMEILHEECAGNTVTAACCSSTYTEDSIRWTQTAEHIGLDAVMNVPPFYYPLTDEELRRYYHDLADACPEIGLVIYNFPIVAQRLSEDLMFRLAEEIPTLCGSKESHLDYNVWLRLHRGCNLSIFTAVERIWFTTVFRQGSRGIFSTLSASVPGLVAQLYAACREGDWARADALEADVWSLCDVLDTRGYLAPYNPIARNKALVNACGWLRAGHCRAPLRSVPEKLVQRLRSDLEPTMSQWLAEAERLAAT